MKGLGELLGGNNTQKRKISASKVDENMILHALYRVIRREYGNQGVSIIQEAQIKNDKIYLKVDQSIWRNEFWMNRKVMVQWINQELGQDANISDLRIHS